MYFTNMKKDEYHVINIKEVEWGNLQWSSNYHSTLFNPQTKEMAFALFIGIVGLCCWGQKEITIKFHLLIHMLNHHFPLYLMIQDLWMSIETKYHNGQNIGRKTHYHTSSSNFIKNIILSIYLKYNLSESLYFIFLHIHWNHM
jgi:hypothetical protein